MITLKLANINDASIIKEYLIRAKSLSCDYTLGNLLMWNSSLSLKYTIYKDTLIILKEYQIGKFAFLFPIGNSVNEALCEVEDYCLANKMRLAFYSLTLEQVNFLKLRYKYYIYDSKREWSDYIYNVSDLRDLPGHKYESKRGNIKRFYKKYPTAIFKVASKYDTAKLLDFLNIYFEENKSRDISLKEFKFSFDLIKDHPNIDSKVGYMELDGKIIGLSSAEIIGDMIDIHTEKALREYEGIYQALGSAFLKAFADGVKYVNREEDDGNEGLRNAKLQLHPIMLIDKYYFDVMNQIDLLHTLPNIKTSRLTLSPLAIKDKILYADMAKDEELNKLWGYNYKNDLNGRNPDENYFYDDVYNDYKNKATYALVIHNQENIFIGEVVLYDFDKENSAQIGVRILKQYQHSGYATESCDALISYAFKTLGLSYLRYECYKENTKSLTLAKILQFALVSEDDNKFYLRRNNF